MICRWAGFFAVRIRPTGAGHSLVSAEGGVRAPHLNSHRSFNANAGRRKNVRSRSARKNDVRPPVNVRKNVRNKPGGKNKSRNSDRAGNNKYEASSFPRPGLLAKFEGPDSELILLNILRRRQDGILNGRRFSLCCARSAQANVLFWIPMGEGLGEGIFE